MLLTRLALNPARRGTARLVADPQAMHAGVLAGFPGATSGMQGEGRVLWRLDRGKVGRHDLYVVSPEQPDYTHLVEQAGWPTTATWQTRDYRPLLERLQPDQNWIFRLTANPVHAVRSSGEERTKPRGHVTVAQQLAWLVERTARLGFEVPLTAQDVPDVVVSDRRTLTFRRGGGHVTLTQATYDGRLVVRDAAALRQALVAGVGRGKGYGCGLLTLAPS